MDITQLWLTTLSTIVSTVIGIAVKLIYDKMERAEKRRREERQHELQEQECMKSGLRAMLRNSILHGCMKYIACGSKPMYEINNIGSMYDAYHALGGNGSVTRMYRLFTDLPVREGEKYEHKE